MDTYINAGAAQGVRFGDRFLVWNPTVRLIAILKVQSVQDRMSTVSTEAQLAAIRAGDNVKRITPEVAADMKKRVEALGGYAPELGSTVEVDPNIIAISRSVGFAIPPTDSPSISVSATAKPLKSGPDVSDILLLAKAAEKGLGLSWNTPAAGNPSAGYNLYRSTVAASTGDLLNPQPMPDFTFNDETVQEGITYYYRLAGVGAEGVTSTGMPSLEATWTAPKTGTMGFGGKEASIQAISLPLFIKAPVKPAAPGRPPKTRAGAAASIPPAPAMAPPPTPVAAAIPAIPAPTPAVPAPAPAALAPVPSPSSSPAVDANSAKSAGKSGLPLAGAPVAPPVPAAAPVPAIPPVPAPSTPKPAPAPVPAATPPPAEPPPTAAVPVPEKVSVSIEGSTAVIRWNPAYSKAPIAGYMVYRAFPDDQTGTALTSDPTSDTTYKDRSAKEGLTYVYWVCTQNAEGKLSSPSNKAKAEIPKSTGVPFF